MTPIEIKSGLTQIWTRRRKHDKAKQIKQIWAILFFFILLVIENFHLKAKKEKATKIMSAA